jgi:hypothetical protein
LPFSLGRPFPRNSETTCADANSKRFIQMHRYLGQQSHSEDLRAVRLGSRAYIGLGSESAGTEARCMVTGW